MLVQEASAAWHAAQAGYLLVLDGEVVVVCDLVAFVDGLLGVNDDLLAVADGQNARGAVWSAAVVDEATEVALHGRVNDDIVVDSAGAGQTLKTRQSSTTVVEPSGSTHKR